VRGRFDPPAFVLWFALTVWIAGFEYPGSTVVLSVRPNPSICVTADSPPREAVMVVPLYEVFFAAPIGGVTDVTRPSVSYAKLVVAPPTDTAATEASSFSVRVTLRPAADVVDAITPQS
jgi:hypothetical protein